MLTVTILLSLLLVAFTSFADVTSEWISTGGYTVLTAAVRDLYSKEVLFLAQPRLRFAQFAKVKTDIQALRGKSIIFVKYQNLAGGGALAENQVLLPEGMGSSQIQIPVTEQGNAIQVTEYLLRTSLLDVLGDASKLLANNFAVVLDGQFKATVLTTTNIVFGNGKTSSATLVAGDGLTTQTVKDAVEGLATNNAPRFNDNMGEYYVCIAHPHQLRQLRDDPNWINANTYMGRRQLYVGEVGMYEGVIFIESTQMTPLTNAQAVAIYGTFAPTTGYQAVFFGENAYAWAIALPVELRDDGVVEFGRKHSLAWYGIWGTGVIEPLNIYSALTA
jgi:N4-gp56 family major capsid protein